MMRIRLSELRKKIVRALDESGPYIRNALSPDSNSREGLKSMGKPDLGNDPDEELPPHLRDVHVDPADCYGPVPPFAPDPYVTQDPLVRDYSPLPTSAIRR